VFYIDFPLFEIPYVGCREAHFKWRRTQNGIREFPKGPWHIKWDTHFFLFLCNCIDVF